MYCQLTGLSLWRVDNVIIVVDVFDIGNINGSRPISVPSDLESMLGGSIGVTSGRRVILLGPV
jgi:hypothetical protein